MIGSLQRLDYGWILDLTPFVWIRDEEIEWSGRIQMRCWSFTSVRQLGMTMRVDDKARFAMLIEPQLNALYRAAYRLCRNQTDAQDLVQDVCLRAFDRLAQFEAIDAPRAWLLRIEYNMFVDKVRRDSRSPIETKDDASIDFEQHASSESGPDAQFEAEQLVEHLSEAWQLLSSDQQALLALHAEGYSLAELTEIFDLPLTALKARLHRARVRLGKLINANQRRPRFVAVSGESA